MLNNASEGAQLGIAEIGEQLLGPFITAACVTLGEMASRQTGSVSCRVFGELPAGAKSQRHTPGKVSALTR